MDGELWGGGDCQGGDTVADDRRLQTGNVARRRFLDRLNQQRAALARTVQGIDCPVQRDRYAAVIINRLLFWRLLPGDRPSPEQMLATSRAAGPDRYYPHVLRQWFGRDSATHPLALPPDLFRARSIEDSYPQLTIPDAAFDPLFAFMREFGGLLTLSRLSELDSTVFAQGLLPMAPHSRGVYYTAADVTQYICECTILPAILVASGIRLGRFHSLRRYARSDRLPPDPGRASLDDLVSHNLDLRSLTQDWLTSIADRDAVAALYWNTLPHLAVLDPTCGTGAFVLAAADVLTPVYQACQDRLGIGGGAQAGLRMILGHNLRGVDIMEEAVELVGLRLALRCVAAPGGWTGPLPGSTHLTVGDILTQHLLDQSIDVIVGNPPYVELRDLESSAHLREFRSAVCGNLYAPIIERCLRLLREGGWLGMIVQLPLICTDRMAPSLKTLIDSSRTAWFSGFDDRPSRLFDRLEHSRTAVVMLHRREGQLAGPELYCAGYNRWYAHERPTLFRRLTYTPVTDSLFAGNIPKLGDPVGIGVLNRIRGRSPLSDSLCERGIAIHYHNAPQYWVRAMDFVPYFHSERDGRHVSQQIKTLHACTWQDAGVITAVLNSTLFYVWYVALSDCRHLNRREINSFPLGLELMTDGVRERLGALCGELMRDLIKHSRRRTARYKTTGRVEYDEFHPAKSKAIIDRIDGVLALHYGLTDEQLAWVRSYDFRYRMGADG